MDHDRLFKELLTHFFAESVDLFLVDLVMRARFRGEDAFFLVHVETQSTAKGAFPKRMFRYFARLTER